MRQPKDRNIVISQNFKANADSCQNCINENANHVQ